MHGNLPLQCAANRTYFTNLYSSRHRCHNFKACAPAWIVDMSALQVASSIIVPTFFPAVCSNFWRPAAACAVQEVVIGSSLHSWGVLCGILMGIG